MEGNIEDFIATGGRMLVSHITYIIALKTWKKFHISQHKMKVTIVTSGWVKMRFRMKRAEKIDNSNIIDKITLT